MKVNVKQTKSIDLSFKNQKKVTYRFMLKRLFGINDKIKNQKIKDDGKGQYTLWRQRRDWKIETFFLGSTDDAELTAKVQVFNAILDLDDSTPSPKVESKVDGEF